MMAAEIFGEWRSKHSDQFHQQSSSLPFSVGRQDCGIAPKIAALVVAKDATAKPWAAATRAREGAAWPIEDAGLRWENLGFHSEMISGNGAVSAIVD